MPRTAKMEPYKRDDGKWTMDTMVTGTRYRPVFDTEAEILTDIARIKRQFAGVGLDAEKLRAYDAAEHSLQTFECPGRGKDIGFVVRWFQQHFVGEKSDKTLREWAKDYCDAKALVLEDKSLREVQQYITDHFVPLFGHQTPLQTDHVVLAKYLKSHPSRWHRDKILRNFYAWLAGEECKQMATLANAPLKETPFKYIVKLKYKRATDEVAILFIEGLKAAIKLAIEKHPEVLGQLIFLALTGLRPDCEAPPFWKLEKHGWRKIDYKRRLLTVTSEIEKTGTRGRQLVLQSNVVEWLQYFQTHNTPMTCSRYAWRKFKAAAYPEKQKVQDLLRHTAISNYVKRLTIFEVEHQFATSKEMIMNHYLAQIADEAEVEEFFNLTPASFGLV